MNRAAAVGAGVREFCPGARRADLVRFLSHLDGVEQTGRAYNVWERVA